MAKEYPRPGGWDSLRPSSSTDRIIGSKEEKRSTKTFISSEKSSIILSLIKNHAESLHRAIATLDMEEKGLAEPRPLEDLIEDFPGLKAWLNLHQELVEHGVSVQGFSLKVAARVEGLQHDAAQRAESSIQTNKREPEASIVPGK